MAKTRSESTSGKIGRNARCPCGSGKKYKRCCGAAPRPGGNAVVVEQGARFCCGELGGYALARALEETRLRVRLPADRRQALARCSAPAHINPLATEIMVELLANLGVAVSQASFKRQAQGQTSAWAVGQGWMDHVVGDLPADVPGAGSAEMECFLGLCAVELWRRWIPERPSAEMLGDLIDEGYGELEQGRRAAAVERWYRAWRTVAGRLGPQAGPGELEQQVCTTRSVTRWLEDLGFELCVAARNDPAAWLGCAVHALDSIRAVPELDDWAGASQRRAELLFVMGRRAEVRLACGAPAWQAGLLVCGQLAPPPADLVRARELLQGVEPRWASGLLEAIALLEGQDADGRALIPERARVELLRPLCAGVPEVLRWQIAADGAAAVPHLEALLGDQDEPRHPRDAAMMLGQLRCPEAVGPLLARLELSPPGSWPWAGCSEGLSRLGPLALEPALAAHRWSSDPGHRAGLLAALARMGVHDDRVLALLGGALGQDPVGGAALLAVYGDYRGVNALSRMRDCARDSEEICAHLDAAIDTLGGPFPRVTTPACDVPSWAPASPPGALPN